MDARRTVAAPLLSLALAITVAAAGDAPAAQAARSSTICGPTWTVAPTQASVLSWTGISATAPNDAWAVGNANANTYIEHWNGTSWTNAATLANSILLNAVFARTSTDVWAVGESFQSGIQDTAIEHWNGAAWSSIPSPSPATGSFATNQLNGVVALTANDAWAVGYYIQASAFVPLAEHWDGSRWSVVPLPASASGTLMAVSGSSSGNVWAVGGGSKPLLEHWNGGAWSGAGISSTTLKGVVLSGVTVSSTTNAWAVGYARSKQNPNNNATLAIRWDGHSWAPLTTPAPGTDGTYLNGVTELSAKWVVGVGTEFTSASHSKPLIERWNGSSWVIQASANTLRGLFNAVTSLSLGYIWAAGTSIEQRCP